MAVGEKGKKEKMVDCRRAGFFKRRSEERATTRME